MLDCAREVTWAGLLIVPGAPVRITAHRFSALVGGRIRPTRGGWAFSSRSKYLVQTKETKNQKRDQRNPEKEEVPTSSGYSLSHSASRGTLKQVYTGDAEHAPLLRTPATLPK